jgi:hypothetical protein
MNRDEYNEKVQDMQRFCLSAGLEFRVRPEYSAPPAEPRLRWAFFEIYYGRWRIVGTEENPMRPNVSFDYDDMKDLKLRAEVARDLAA